MAKAKNMSLLDAAKLLPGGTPCRMWLSTISPEDQAEVRAMVKAKVDGEVTANWLTLAKLVKDRFKLTIQDIQIAQHLSDISKGRR